MIPGRYRDFKQPGASSIAGFGAFLVSLAAFSVPALSDGKIWHPWFEIGGYHNTDDASRGEITVFAPLAQSQQSLLFADLRGNFFEEDVKEGNFAVGYRQLVTPSVGLGAWLGGDVRHSELNNTFWQLSGGFEVLSNDFEARLNWYGPASAPQLANDASFTDVVLFNDSIFLVGGE